MTHVAVLGAGITGVTTAFQLYERGFEVTVYDRQRYAAMETSFANGGQLSASNGEVWNSWATVLKGLKWMLKPDAPLLVNPMPTIHKFGWMAEFIANIPKYKGNTIETVQLAQAARPALLGMAERAGIDFDYRSVGILHFYKTEKDFAAARKVSALYAEAGLNRRELSVDEVHEIEPRLKSDILGGYYTDSDSTGDIHKYTYRMAEFLRSKGVNFLMGREIESAKAFDDRVVVADSKGEEHAYDGVVVAAGVGSRPLAKGFGDRVNIYPVKGYSVTVHLEDQLSRDAAPTVSLLDDNSKIVTSRLGDDRLRIAGTAEFNGTNRDIRADRIRPLVEWCEKYFPDITTEHVEPWAGLRPMMPGMLPRVGKGKHPRVFYNTGHGHLGWTLAGITAEMVGDVVAGSLREAEGKAHVSVAVAAQ